MSTKKTIAAAVAITIAGVCAAYWFIFTATNTTGNSQDFNISIRSDLTIDQFLSTSGIPIQNSSTFQLACLFKRLKRIKPGRYVIGANMSNNQIIQHLRSGGAPVVQMRIDNLDDIFGLAGRLGESLMYDSASFIDTMLSPNVLSAYETDSAHLACIIIPNTYEFYWNMSPRTFLDRMKKEHSRVWNDERNASAQQIGLSPQEVATLASIVKAETAVVNEAPRIAGLYLNRLRMGMPLQSDPTATFGQKNKRQRVYQSDLESENPYNTYKIAGLPPGPINFPEVVYLDAVLQAEKNNYIYMCAQPGGTGLHNFSSSYAEHTKNRQRYIQWLEEKGIR